MKKHHNNGFTLVELMITVIVAAILISVATPGLVSLMQNSRGNAMASDLLRAMTLARSESVKRGNRVMVCSSANQSTCAASTDWTNGWIVFVDTDANGSFNDDGDANRCEVDAGNQLTEDCLLQVWDAPKGDATLTGSLASVFFNSTGSANSDMTVAITCMGTNTRTVSVALTGRVEITSAACP